MIPVPTFYHGVCGADRGFGDQPAGCGRPFALQARDVTVVRWVGAHPDDQWQVLGRCPECRYLCIWHTCQAPAKGVPRDIIDLLMMKAPRLKMTRPAELDDPEHHLLGSPLPKEEAADLAEAVMACDGPKLEKELALWVEEMGS